MDPRQGTQTPADTSALRAEQCQRPRPLPLPKGGQRAPRGAQGTRRRQSRKGGRNGRGLKGWKILVQGNSSLA